MRRQREYICLERETCIARLDDWGKASGQYSVEFRKSL